MKTKHVHKFRRHTHKTGNRIFFCALPDCNVKMNPALALGKKCICWRCGEEFILNEYSIRLAKPHCDNCHQPKGQKDLVSHLTQIQIEHMQKATANDESILKDIRNIIGTSEMVTEDEEDI